MVVVMLRWGFLRQHEAAPLMLGILLFLLDFGGLAIVLPIVIADLAHAYWVLRGKTAAAYSQEAGDQPSAASHRSSSMG